jgi:hypothetical protein
MSAEVVEKIPGVKAAVVTIGKDKAHRVGSNGLDALDFDVPLAGLQDFLPGTVTTRLGRRSEYPEELAAEFEALAVRVTELEDSRFLVQPDVGGDRSVPFDASHDRLQ